MDKQFFLQHNWTNMDKTAEYIDTLTYTVKGSEVTIYSEHLNDELVIMWGGPRSWRAYTKMSLDKARKHYKQCLKQGYKPVKQASRGRYYDQPEGTTAIRDL